ncbi:hypothetical protein ACA910_016232 [Epithemia clementina (nom. ined.)]
MAARDLDATATADDAAQSATMDPAVYVPQPSSPVIEENEHKLHQSSLGSGCADANAGGDPIDDSTNHDCDKANAKATTPQRPRSRASSMKRKRKRATSNRHNNRTVETRRNTTPSAAKAEADAPLETNLLTSTFALHQYKDDANIPEVGYFLLQEEPIRFIGQRPPATLFHGWQSIDLVLADDPDSTSPRSETPASKTSHVGTSDSHEQSCKSTTTTTSTNPPTNGLDVVSLRICPHTGQLSLSWSELMTFHGMVESTTVERPTTIQKEDKTNNREMKDEEEDVSLSRQEKNTSVVPKSDLACLLGLLKLFPNVVAIKSFQILLIPHDNIDETDDDDDDKKDGECIDRLDRSDNHYCHCLDCAVLVTVGFPLLTILSSYNEPTATTKRTTNCSIVPTTTSARGGGSAKILHPAIQLLLQIIQSDWECLDDRMKILQQQQEEQRRKTTSSSHWGNQNREQQPQRQTRLFPPRLSLEELYLRMQGLPTQSPHVFLGDTRKLSKQQHCPLIQLLPQEVLAERIAPFLRARTLDALRCSCSYLHHVLQAVVPGLPRLRLYQHQISSLAWMRDRETRQWSESEVLVRSSSWHDKNHSCLDGDWHRAVTGGQSTLLRTKDGIWTCRLQQTTGTEWHTTGTMRQSIARGGLLADEPGLGKTITVLSLILQTSGLATTKRDPDCNQGNIDDDDVGGGGRESRQITEQLTSEEEIFRAYWKESVPTDFRRADLLSLTNRFVQKNRAAIYIPVAEIKAKIGRDGYDDFEPFVVDMLNAIQSFFEESSDQPNDGDLLKTQFLDLVGKYKKKQMQSAAKSCSKARLDSSVTALYEAYERRKFLDSLIRSKGTLVVVPSVLLDHWRDQIELHVDFSYTTRKKPLIFEFGKSGEDVDSVVEKVWNLKTHDPIVLIDRAPSKPLPDAEFLAAFHIVITSNNRFMHEWKNGSFQEEISRMSEESGTKEGLELTAFKMLDRSGSACPLLKVHWLRLIVDEGHSMGRTQQNSSVKFASWISAERRWAMTGTPTKHGSGSIAQVLALFGFLQHDFFTARCEGDSHWKNCIAKPWKCGDLSGYFRLRSLLGVLMKRHTKADIVELPPPPLSKCSAVPMSSSEVETYNSIATAVQINLVLTSLTVDGWQDSLLHVSNRKHATLALANLRRVCAGYSRVIPSLTDKAWSETVHLADKYGLSKQAKSDVKEYMTRAIKGGLSDCACCGLSLTVLIVTPCCGALICTDCVDTEIDSGSCIDCLLCSRSFHVDTLQRFQPGFVMEWLENLQDSASKRRGASATGEIPQGSSTSMADLVNEGEGERIIRPPQERRRTRKIGDGHKCQYDSFSVSGQCTLCLAEHDSCNLVETGRCQVCHRQAIECPKEESKSSYLVSKLLELVRSKRNYINNGAADDSSERPFKAIVFSQYRGALNLTGTHMLRRFGAACVAEYWGRYRTDELRKFIHSKECFCMLLGKDGSEGLDLSFVTHIFFLEEIWDRSLADQAVSRAWRMGARGRVQVETLVAEHSVEETMADYERSATIKAAADSRTAAELASSKDYQAAKTHALLRSLRYLTTYQSFRKATPQPYGNSGYVGVPFPQHHPIKREEDEALATSPVKRLSFVNENWIRMYGAQETVSGDHSCSSPPKKRKLQRRRVAFDEGSNTPTEPRPGDK